jgi:hypothetical protein
VRDSGSLAMHAAMGVVATAQVGHDPCVLVWEVATCKLLARISGFHQVAIPECSNSRRPLGDSDIPAAAPWKPIILLVLPIFHIRAHGAGNQSWEG